MTIRANVAEIKYIEVELEEPENWPPKKGDIWGNSDTFYFAHGTGWGSTQMRLPSGGQIHPEQMLWVCPDIELVWRKQ